MTTPCDTPLAALEAQLGTIQFAHARNTIKAVRTITPPSHQPQPVTDDTSADYYRHILRCQQCRDQDMCLCAEGYDLLCRMAGPSQP